VTKKVACGLYTPQSLIRKPKIYTMTKEKRNYKSGDWNHGAFGQGIDRCRSFQQSIGRGSRHGEGTIVDLGLA
jgi:hypothetical protein